MTRHLFALCIVGLLVSAGDASAQRLFRRGQSSPAMTGPAYPPPGMVMPYSSYYTPGTPVVSSTTGIPGTLPSGVIPAGATVTGTTGSGVVPASGTVVPGTPAQGATASRMPTTGSEPIPGPTSGPISSAGPTSGPISSATGPISSATGPISSAGPAGPTMLNYPGGSPMLYGGPSQPYYSDAPPTNGRGRFRLLRRNR